MRRLLALLAALAPISPSHAQWEDLERKLARIDALYNGTRRSGHVAVDTRSRDAVALAPVVQEILDAAALVDSHPIWPGFRVLDQPILLLDGDKRSWLIGHPSPPSGFRRAAGTGVSVADGAAISLSKPFDFHLSFAGHDTFAFNLEKPDDPSGNDTETVIHERFHIFQETGFKTIVPKGSTVEDVENHALAGLEQHALRAAVSAKNNKERRRYARMFVAARAERQSRWGDSLGAYEDYYEQSEGMAEYAEQMAAARMSVQAGVPFVFERLKSLDSTPDLHDMMRGRYYATGLAQGILLDQAEERNWKLHIQGGMPLAGLMGKAYPVSAGERDAVLDEAKAALDYPTLREQARLVLAKHKAERDQALRDFEAQRGIFVRIPPHPSGNRAGGGFTSAGEWFEVDEGSLHTDIVTMEVALPDLSWVVRDRPVIDGADVRFATGDSPLTATVNGERSPFGEGAVPFRTLLLESNGFRLTTTVPGELVLKGRELSIRWMGGAPQGTSR